MIKNFAPVFFILILLYACSSPQKKLQTEIKEKERELFSDSTYKPDPSKATRLVELYIEYADKYKDDTTSADYLFKAADLSNNLHQPMKAIELYGRVQEYRDYKRVPAALFLQGFISETEIHDLEKAKEYYQRFLQKYPNDDLADDVQMSLNNLGKSPEEMIKEFEKHHSDSIAAR